MKKTILLLSAIILLFAGCKKFDDIEASKLEIKNEIIEKGWDYIKISGEYAYPVELESMTLLLSEKEDMSGVKSYSCVLEGKTFSVEVTDLKEGVTYFYCYEYDNGYGKERSEASIELFHGYVDLGLPSGLKWATCNIGASSPEDYGNYYAWGETIPKAEYTSSNCSTYGVQMNDISGNVQYDAATANLGGSWRMPTKTEFEELINSCTWTWITQNGVSGYEVTGTNGNNIFLPATGYRCKLSLTDAGESGYYWSSTPSDGYYDYSAYDLYFYSTRCYVGWIGRYDGRTIRPVSE